MAAVLAPATAAGDTATAAPDFDREVRPILVDKCFQCHGPDESAREGELRLDLKAPAFAGGASGEPAIVPGNATESQLIARITSTDPADRMPPEDADLALEAGEIDLLRRWVEAGATWQEHWSFVPPRRPPLPEVKLSTWPRNGIDHFTLARLEGEGLAPSPEADRETLIRRVTFDLTGMPPTIAEIDAFLFDSSPDAYERVVDRLLRSARYGEHMARYWLDAARYGDTHGLHLDNFREMWLYRDWVVSAFNRNLPFDRFVIEQLAGDLLPDPTQDQRIATGFNRCHVTTNEGGAIKEEWYVRNVVDRVVTTGTVFMGLTMECSRCHDHKYDPLTMRDFYSLFAFFNSLDGSPLDGNKAEHPPIERVIKPREQQQLEELQQAIAERNQRLDAPWEEVDAAQQSWEAQHRAAASAGKDDGKDNGKEDTAEKTPDDILAILSIAAGERSPDQVARLRGHYRRQVGQQEELITIRAELKERNESLKRLNASFPTTLIYRETKEPRPAYMLVRGEYDQRGEERDRGVPTALPPMRGDLPRNRLGLAQWLVDPQHPLTARVTINRFWQRLFGTGLVKTAEDFGTRGERPSHPRLLDWLAVRFFEDGWDVKATMKRIVMSATYRQTSRVAPELRTRDPHNRLLARGPRFRLDAEMLRDQALSVSGLLVERLGGPSVKPPQPDGLWFAVGYSGSNTVRFKADEGPEKVHRRTLYTFIKRTAPPPQMSTFDGPSREACTVQRARTNTPMQALLLFNDPQYIEAARGLALRAMQQGGETDASRGAFMFRLCTGRAATEFEIRDLLDGYRTDARHFAKHAEATREFLNFGGSASPADYPLHELAAWTMAANTLLCLDEVVTKN